MALLLLLLGIRVLSGFNGLYSQDSHEYLRIATEWKANGNISGPLYWPLTYPVLTSWLSSLSGSVLGAAQLLSMLAFAGSLAFAIKTLQILYGARNIKFPIGVYAFVALGLAPFALRLATMVMSDSLCVLGLSGFFYFSIKYLKNRELIWILLTAAFAVLAVLTRFVAVLILLPYALYLLVQLLKSKAWLHLCIGIFSALLCLIFYQYVQPGDTLATLSKGLGEWSFSHFFTGTYETAEGMAHYPQPNVIQVLFNWVHPGFFGLGGLVLIFAVLKPNPAPSRERLLLLVTVVAYALFLAGLNVQNRRFLFLTFPLIVIWSYPTLRELAKRYLHQNWQIYGIFALWLLVQGGLFYRSMQPVIQRNQLEQSIARDLQQYPAQTLYTFEIDLGLRSYEVQQPLVNLWETEVRDPKKGSLLLFNLPQFEKRWAGKMPMLNYKYLSENYRLHSLQQWPHGWELYEIQ